MIPKTLPIGQRGVSTLGLAGLIAMVGALVGGVVLVWVLPEAQLRAVGIVAVQVMVFVLCSVVWRQHKRISRLERELGGRKWTLR